MNKSVKTFDGLDHQSTPEEEFHQIYAYMLFTMREQPLDPVAYIHWHKRKAAKKCFLSGIALGWFCGLKKSTKMIGLLLYLLLKNNFLHRKLHITHKLRLAFQQKNKLKTYVKML